MNAMSPEETPRPQQPKLTPNRIFLIVVFFSQGVPEEFLNKLVHYLDLYQILNKWLFCETSIWGSLFCACGHCTAGQANQKGEKKPAYGRPHNLSKCAKKSNEKTRKIKENLVKTMKTKKTRKIKKSQKNPSKTKEKHTNNTTWNSEDP